MSHEEGIKVLRVKADPRDCSDEERRHFLKGLAGAISHSLRDAGEVEVRCVGNACIGKGAKAMVMASQFIFDAGLILYCRPAYFTADMGGGEEKSGIKFNVFGEPEGEMRPFRPDLVELKVKADDREADEDVRRNSMSKLAGAVAHNLRSAGQVQVRAIGNACIGKMAKAVAQASGFVAVNGYDLYCRPGFITVDMGGESKNGVKFDLFVEPDPCQS